jgi:RNA polymerase sigma-70 factor (ECF subfamily)
MADVPGPSGPVDFETSLALFERARAGDAEARDALLARYLPRLQRWATGRLPARARGATDTQDVVQDTVIQTFRRLERIEVRGEGALLAYLRQGVLNRIRDHFRRAERRPEPTALDSQMAGTEASPLECAIGVEATARYERALQQLKPDDRAAIIARVELGASNEEIAAALGKPSANAARMAVERALVRLVDAMRKDT